MASEIDKIIRQTNELQKLLDDLNSTTNEYADSIEGNISKLTDTTEKYSDELKKVIKAVNTDLNTKIDINNLGKGLSSLQENLEKTKNTYKKVIESISQLKKEIKNANSEEEKAKLEDKLKKRIELQKNLNAKITEQGKAISLLTEKGGDYLKSLKSLNEEQEKLNKKQKEGYNALDRFSENATKKSKLLVKGIEEITNGTKSIFNSVKNTLEPWSKANDAAMKYARSVGMSERTADAYLKNTVKWAAKNDIGVLFNKTTNELIEMQGKYSDVLGRNVQLTGKQKKDMLAMDKFLGEDGMMSMANNLENFGLGMSDSAEFVHKTMNEATKYGISASKLTKTINDNIKMAQNYTFKNGLEGLSSMAKKAIELKTDMSLVNGFLEKVSTVEGAISTGAQLQVLGGGYAMGSDPLSMMYESLNNAEGLFDRAVGMAKGKVFYNEKSGNFEMGSQDRYMMKQAATAMGIDPSKLIDVAYRQASLGKIEQQAKLNSNIAGDEEMMNLVKNLATWDKGQAVVNIDGKDKKVTDLDEKDKEKLQAMQRTDSQNLQEMAINLRSMNEIMGGVEKETNNEQANATKSVASTLDKMLGNNTEILNAVANINAWYNIINGAFGVITGIFTVVRGLSHTGQGAGNLIQDILGDSSGGRGNNRQRSKRNIKPGKGNIKTGILRNNLSWNDIKGGFKQDGNFIKYNGKTYKDLGNGVIKNINGGKTLKPENAAKIIQNGKKVKSLTTFGKVASKSLKMGGVGALAGGALSLGTDILSGEFVKDKQTSFQRAAGQTLGAGIGMALGGPVGAMIGGWIAGTVTDGIEKAQKKNRAKVRDEIANKFSAVNSNISDLFKGDNALEGNYNKNDLNKIAEALKDNELYSSELSESLLSKLRENNDLIKIKQNGVKLKDIGLANGGELVGNSHAQGGMPILGSNIEVEGGEFVVNKHSTNKYRGLLNKINNDKSVTPIEPLGKQMTVINNTINNPQINKNKIDIPPISINLSGVIKLDSGSKQVDVSEDLLKNPTLISKLTEMISKELNILTNGSYNKEKMIQKFV